MIHKQYYVEQDKVEQLIARKNQKSRFLTEFMTGTGILSLPGSLYRFPGVMI